MTQVSLRAAAAGGGKTSVTTSGGSSIGTDVVRVLLDDATAANKNQVLQALEAIRQRIVEANWPLA